MALFWVVRKDFGCVVAAGETRTHASAAATYADCPLGSGGWAGGGGGGGGGVVVGWGGGGGGRPPL